MKIFLGADHGGFKLKERLKEWMEEEGWEVEDLGAYEHKRKDDYVDYGERVAKKVREEKGRGVVLCRNGVGMDIVCNRFQGVRCVLGFDKKQVRRAREDDKVNVLSLPADYIKLRQAKKLVGVFMKTEFKGKRRFKRRLEKVEELGV